MTSTYSTDLKLELMVTGENAGTWGDKTNTNLNLVQQAIAGVESVTLTNGGTVALAMSNAALSNARNMVIKFATITLSGASVVTIPDGIEKFYIFDITAVTNPSNLTIKTVSGTGFSPAESKIVAAYADGTNLNEIALDTLGGTIGTAQIADNAITSAKISANQVTTAKIPDNAITSAKISASQVTAAKIAQSTITQTKLAADSVGANQLIATTVSAGTYTAATITVDADGRLTGASSGSAGATGYTLGLVQKGPASGTYTAASATTRLKIYMQGGGGGTGGKPSNGSGRGGGGGNGGLGFFDIPISAPYSVPFSVGAIGNGGGPVTAGNAGGATTFADPAGTLTVNGGAGGGAAPSGNAFGTKGANGTASPASDVTGFDDSYFVPQTIPGSPSNSRPDTDSTSFHTFGLQFGLGGTGIGGVAAQVNSPANGTTGRGVGMLVVLENGKTY
jgi:hypothetical protein